MNCQDCGCRLEVIKTMVMEDVTQRLRECGCGSRFLTTEVVTRKLPVTPPTASQRPANSSSQSSSSGSALSLPVSKLPDQTQAREAKTEPTVKTFSVVGKDGPTWNLLESDHKKLVAAFPGVDATAEYAKIALWAEANPQRRKTGRGMKAFLIRWFDRAQNDAARKSPKGPSANDPRCAFHRATGTLGKAPRFGLVASCPECKHVGAANGTRRSEPATFDWTRAPSAEQLAALHEKKAAG